MAVAALFDIDGTLIACQSGPLYIRHLRRTGHASLLDLVKAFVFLVQYRLGLLDIQRASQASMGLVRGLHEASILDDCRRWYEREVRGYLRPAMVATVEEGHRVRINGIAMDGIGPGAIGEGIAGVKYAGSFDHRYFRYPSSAPPETWSMWPVMKRAFSERRKTQASAITLASGQLPSGCIESR